jgi:hypothetical protein
MPVAYTIALSVQVLDFNDICRLIRINRLYALHIRRASALPAGAPCRAHQIKQPNHPSMVWLIESEADEEFLFHDGNLCLLNSLDAFKLSHVEPYT